MENTIELSIIIVNWNVRELLYNCLTSVGTHLNCHVDTYEIIVVDNASSDGSVEMVRDQFPGVTLIEKNENVGFGRGCNEGYGLARGEFILMLNPDTVITGPDIDILLDKIKQDSTIGVIGPRMINEDGIFRRDSGGNFPTLAIVVCHYLFINHLIPRRFRPKSFFLENDPQGTFEIDWVSGAGMLLRRSAIHEPVFDEDFFMFGEDMDLCDRLHCNGWGVIYTSQATIVHYLGQSFKKQSSLEVLQTIHKGPRLFFQKKHKAWKLTVYDLVLMVGYLARWLLYGIASIIFPSKGYGELSRFSRQFLSIMISVLFKKK